MTQERNKEIIDQLIAGTMHLQGGWTSDTVWSCWYDVDQSTFVQRSYDDQGEEKIEHLSETTVAQMLESYGEKIVHNGTHM